jgi:hypothetical protein
MVRKTGLSATVDLPAFAQTQRAPSLRAGGILSSEIAALRKLGVVLSREAISLMGESCL